MKKYVKMLSVMMVTVATTMSAMAFPVFYTILHSLEEAFSMSSYFATAFSKFAQKLFAALDRFHFFLPLQRILCFASRHLIFDSLRCKRSGILTFVQRHSCIHFLKESFALFHDIDSLIP